MKANQTIQQAMLDFEACKKALDHMEEAKSLLETEELDIVPGEVLDLLCIAIDYADDVERGMSLTAVRVVHWCLNVIRFIIKTTNVEQAIEYTSEAIGVLE